MILANPSNPDFAQLVRSSFARQGLMRLIDAELMRVEPGMIEIKVPYRADLTQQDGYLHAGIVTAIADTACGYAAYTLMPRDSDVLSVEFKINLLRPAKGEAFLARAEVIKPGKTLTVVRADVFNFSNQREEKPIATMQATMICLPKSRSTATSSGDRVWES
jgi:uncharacterized protein (TIGR00369 family)